MEKESKYLLPALTTSQKLVKSQKFSSGSEQKSSVIAHHANVKRHVIGLSKGYSKREMEKQAKYLLSINHMQMLPRNG